MRFMKNIILSVMCLCVLHGCRHGEEILQPSKEYYDSVVKELSSAKYYGRSNYNNGALKAAEFVIGEMEKLEVGPVPADVVGDAWEGKERPQLHGLQPEFKSQIDPCGPGRWEGAPQSRLAYLQHFSHPLNAQRGAVELIVDGDTLVNTVEYTLKEFSPTFKGELEVAYVPDEYITPEKFCKHLNSGAYKDKAAVVDWDVFCQTMYTYPGIEVYKTYFVPMENVGALICKGSALLPYFKSRNHFNTPMPVFMVDSSFPTDARRVSINVEAEMVNNDAHNIIAYIPGTSGSKRHYVVSCHYDHLGVCGNDIFYGASDNSSGTAMLLNLMRHYKQNPPEHPILFIFFDAEENNLLGSFFYADNPLLPSEDIIYFIELDMIGDNGNNIICQISPSGGEGLEYLKKVNSSFAEPFASFRCEPFEDYADHYPFGLKGVPAIYMELDGDTNKNYHSPRDNYENFSSANYDRMFELVTKFIDGYEK